jgi:hypothetical protein
LQAVLDGQLNPLASKTRIVFGIQATLHKHDPAVKRDAGYMAIRPMPAPWKL